MIEAIESSVLMGRPGDMGVSPGGSIRVRPPPFPATARPTDPRIALVTERPGTDRRPGRAPVPRATGFWAILSDIDRPAIGYRRSRRNGGVVSATPDIAIRRLLAVDEPQVDGLVDLLIDCVEGGASASFMAPARPGDRARVLDQGR